MTQTLSAMLAAEFGDDYENLVNSLPSNPDVAPYSKRALSEISMIVLHHTEAPRATTWQSVNRYHIDHNGWYRAGYHIAIRDYAGRCMVSLLNLPETRSYHAHTVGNNHGIAVCVAGKFDYDVPTIAETDALQRTVAVIRRWATWCEWAPVVRHGDVPGNSTACPGKHWRDIVPILNTRAVDDEVLRAAIWDAAKGAQKVSPNPGSAIELFMAEQGYQRIGEEVPVILNGVWQGVTALGYYPGGNANGVAFYATNTGPSGEWAVHMVEAP